ncbi:MAG: hypothetical protein JNJ57_15110 [Saprospiraceae bacterium]|nr:hypothetical protein [Saprospiraceae bacterium]
MKSRLFLLLFLCLSDQLAASIPKHHDPCDSLFLSNGRGYAIKNLQTTPEGISFVFCDDPSSQVHQAPWMQIARIKKADGTELVSPALTTPSISEPPLTPAEQALEDKVIGLKKTSNWIFPLLFVGGLGIFLAIIVLITAQQRLRAIVGHPREAKLRKILKRIKLRSWLVIGLFVVAAVILISWLIVILGL